MSRLFLSAAAGAATIACGAPDAAAQVYGGVGASVLGGELPTVGNISQTGGVVRLGAKFNPFLSVEGELQYLDLAYYQAPRFSVPPYYDAGIKNEYGVFAVGWLPIPVVGDLFARAGVVHTSMTTTPSDDTEEGWGVGYGAGLQVGFMAVRLRGEYTGYVVNDVTSHSVAGTLLLQF